MRLFNKTALSLAIKNVDYQAAALLLQHDGYTKDGEPLEHIAAEVK